MQEDPYEFCDVPPQEVINQWIEVGNGIEKSQTGTLLVSMFEVQLLRGTC